VIAGPIPAHVLAPPPDRTLAWAASAFELGARVIGVEPFSTSRWLANHRLTVRSASGAHHDAVLRRWARPGWDQTDPDFDARREATALGLVQGVRVSTPEVIAADVGAAATDVPALLLTLLPGSAPTTAGPPQLPVEMANAIAAIHEVAVAADALPVYRPWHVLVDVARPGWTPKTPSWERLWKLGREPRRDAEVRLIHRDYHHDNTLWLGGHLSAIVDWTTASIGARGVDVAHARWNLALAYGPEAAAAFLSAYRSAVPDYVHDPYWDAVQLIDWSNEEDPPDPVRLARLDRYVNDALSGQ
jgi:aminoglycoside phosphotransferase (APT) family kinase protein